MSEITANKTINKSSTKVIMESGTLSIVPKQAQVSFCFLIRLLITPILEKPIIMIVRKRVVFGNQLPIYKIPNPNSKNG